MFYDADEDHVDDPPPPPHAYLALDRHKASLSYLYSIFEHATERAKDLLKKPGLHHDGSFHCHLVRYLVSNKVRDSAPQTTHGFRFFPLPNTGLEILSTNDRIRIWKAIGDGEIPPPGDSIGRQDYCDQPDDPTLFSPHEYAIINPGRLVLLWDLDASFSLNRFELACPREWNSIWKSPKAHWKLPVPHPANWIQSADNFTGDTDDDFGLDLDALGDEEPEE